MWLLNVVVILPWLFIILLMLDGKYNKLKIYLMALSVICEIFFMTMYLLDKNINNFVQTIVLIFGYLFPMVIVGITKSNKNFKIKVLYFIATFLEMIKKYELSEKILVRIVKIKKTNIKYLYKLSDIYNVQKKLSRQRDILFEIIQLDRNDANAYYELGVVLDKLNKKETAIVMLSNALKIKKDFLEAKEELGIIFSDIGRYDDALSIYKEIIESSDNDNYMAIYNLAIIYSKQGDVTKAIESYSKVLEINPKTSNAWYELGKLYYMQGNNTKAIEGFENALEQDKKDYKILYNLSKCYAVERDYTTAEIMLRKSIALNPDIIKKANKEIVLKEVTEKTNIDVYENIKV